MTSPTASTDRRSEPLSVVFARIGPLGVSRDDALQTADRLRTYGIATTYSHGIHRLPFNAVEKIWIHR
jgi:hypothetical protein